MNINTSFDATLALIADTGKRTVNAMAIARAYMETEETAGVAARAMTQLEDNYKALDKAKRAESALKAGIRAFYKNMSTAVSHERAALKRELKDETKETAALHSRFPFRVGRIKGVYVVMTHAEFDELNANRRNGADDAASSDEDDADASEKGIDAKAVLIAELEARIAELTAANLALVVELDTAHATIKTMRAAAKIKTAKKKVAAKKAA